MAKKKLITVTVTEGTASVTFADTETVNYGTVALRQLEHHEDIHTTGTANGQTGEIFIPYESVIAAVITHSSMDYTAPADEVCQLAGCVADKDLVTLISIGRSTIELQSGVYEYSYTESTPMSGLYVETVSDVTSLEIKVNGETVENDSDITWSTGDNVVSISVANSCATEMYTVTVSYNPGN